MDGTVLAAWTLDELGGTDGAPKKQLVSAIESVAKELGRKAGKALAKNRDRLSPQEAAVLAFLERRLAKSR